MTDAKLISALELMVKEAEDYRDQLSEDRTRAVEYYDGDMRDTPADKGRSQVVSRDVRAAVKKVLPSVLRTILGNDKVVEFSPVGEGDEQTAEQATDYMNLVVLPESDAFDAIHDAVHDALRLRNGVLKWWWEEKTHISVSKYSGLDDNAFATLVNEPDVEVLEHTGQEAGVNPDSMPVMTHDLKIRRRTKRRRARVAAIPPEEFLIHPEATSIDASPLVGQVCKKRRTELVEMGYDADLIAGLPIAGEDETDEEQTRRPDAVDVNGAEPLPELEEIEYYELFVRMDADGDGIAELRRMCFGGKIASNCLLMDEEADEVQFCSVTAERKPHAWEGVSVADDVCEIQRVKTVLLRQTLDNIYWQNNLQPVVDMGAVENLDAVMNPAFGLPIMLKQGFNARDAISYNVVPLVAKESFAMLSYFDEEIQDRTGITDAASGLAPDALQNMTAKASAMMEQAGIGQIEQIVRNIANGLKPMFRGLLKIIIKHQDQPRTVRLRDQWVAFDPRSWNADMDATVNTGLGAGTRERDMMVMQMIMGVQEKLLAGFGPDNPFVKPENVHNAVEKMIQAAGLRSTGMYITKPDPQEVQAKLDAAANQPSPEMEKVKAQMMVKQAEMQANLQEQSARLQLEREKMLMEMELKREQLAQELQLKRELAFAEMEMKKELAVLAPKQPTSVTEVHMGGEPG